MLINYKCKCLLKNEQFFSWNFFESIFYIKIVLKKIFLFCLKKVCKNMQNFFWNFFENLNRKPCATRREKHREALRGEIRR